MIIDCHGHYTTAPKELEDYRKRQIAELKDDPAHESSAWPLGVSDDQIRESLESAQLRIQRERGTNLTILSPRYGYWKIFHGNARRVYGRLGVNWAGAYKE